MSRLSEVDLGLTLSKSEAKKQLKEAQERLVHLRLLLGGQIGSGELGPPLCVLFEGWDASGKGGAIKRLVEQPDRPHLVRPGPRRAGGGLRDRGPVAAGLWRDRRPGDDAGRRGHRAGQVLDAR